MSSWNITYDFRLYPASWDFLQWLMINETERRRVGAGPLRVRFQLGAGDGFRPDPRNGTHRPIEIKHAIYHNVMRPALRLIGAEEQIEPFPGLPRRPVAYLMRQLVKAHAMGVPIPSWHIPAEIAEEMALFLARRKPVVVTLRETSYWPTRNSNLEAWTAFARGCGEDVLFVRDTDKAAEPLPGFETCPRASRELLWRAALMAQAKCNLLVANGPIALALFMAAPWLMFAPLAPEIPLYRPGTAEWWEGKNGVPVGGQYPWSHAGQRIIWEKDTLAAISAAWEQMPRAARVATAARP